MNIKALKAFDIIVTEGTLTEAARRLKLSQPSVSRLISILEDDVKLKLFHRTKRHLTLTGEGEAFYHEVKHIIAGVNEIPRIAEQLRYVRQKFRVIVTHKIAQGLISPALALLHKKKPRLRSAVDVEARIRFEKLVGVKQFDLAIAALPVALSSTAIDTFPLVRSRVEVLLPKHHPLSQKDVIVAKDLRNAPLIGLWVDQQWRHQTDDFLSASGIEGNYVVETRHVMMACELVRYGAGLTLVDRISAQGMDLRGLELRPTEPERWITFGGIFQRGQALSDNARLFMDCIRESAEAMRVKRGAAASISVILPSEDDGMVPAGKP